MSEPTDEETQKDETEEGIAVTTKRRTKDEIIQRTKLDPKKFKKYIFFLKSETTD